MAESDIEPNNAEAKTFAFAYPPRKHLARAMENEVKKSPAFVTSSKAQKQTLRLQQYQVVTQIRHA